MKHCVQFPDDKFLAVRPCLVAICMGNRPAAKLLGVLLYRYNIRLEHKEDAENHNAIHGKQQQDTTFRIFRRQAQLVDDMCGEMAEKTLHDIAIPMLQLLGYLDLEEYMQANCYIVDVTLVQQALNLYVSGAKQQPVLEKFVCQHAQLEKFLIEDQLENILIDKKLFLSQLENILIQNRKVSNSKRGRKPRSDVALGGISRRIQNLKESKKKNTKKESVCNPDTVTPPSETDDAPTHTHFFSAEHESDEKETTTDGRESSGNLQAADAHGRDSDTGTPGLPLATTNKTEFPVDHNLKTSPPKPVKPESNENRPPGLSKPEIATRRKWANAYLNKDGITKDSILTALALRAQWLITYGAYGDAKWDDDALIWIAQQANGSFEHVQKVYSRWQDTNPSKPINPEMIKNKWFWLNDKPKPAKDTSASGGRDLAAQQRALRERYVGAQGGR